MTEVSKAEVLLRGLESPDLIRSYGGACFTIPLGDPAISLPKISRELGYDPDTTKHLDQPDVHMMLSQAFATFETTYKSMKEMLPTSSRLGILARFMVDVHEKQLEVAAQSPDDSVDVRNAKFMALPFLSLSMNAEQFTLSWKGFRKDNVLGDKSKGASSQEFKELRDVYLKGEILDLERNAGSLTHGEEAVLDLYRKLATTNVSGDPEIEKVKDWIKKPSKAGQLIEMVVPLISEIIDGKLLVNIQIPNEKPKETGGKTEEEKDLINFATKAKIDSVIKDLDEHFSEDYSISLKRGRTLEDTLIKLTKILLLEVDTGKGRTMLDQQSLENIKRFCRGLETKEDGSDFAKQMNRILSRALDSIKSDLQDVVITMRDDKFHFDDKRAWEGLWYKDKDGKYLVTPEASNSFLAKFKTSFSRIALDIFHVGQFFKADLKNN